MAGEGRFVGRSVPRLEDAPLVVGQGRFAADISFAHQVYMRVVRSAHANGRIAAIDCADARASAAVIAIWTAMDVADIPPIDFRLTRIESLEPYRQPILARDRVRYVGEPVAVVFATDPYIAEDAADLVGVEIDDLPEIMTADAAPVEFSTGHSTEPVVVRKGYGDVAAAFAAAHATVALELQIGRHSGVPLETRGAIARYNPSRDVLELYGAAKVPHWNRDALARMLGRPASSVHLHEGHTGGGFGVRGELYPEDVLACLGALRLQRPVKWIEDRREHLIATNHSREQHYRVRAAVDGDGQLLAVDGEFLHDQGAYVRTHAVTVPDLAATMLLGPYRVGAYGMAGRVRLTNKTPCGTYRAPGRFESTFVRERLMDAIAAHAEAAAGVAFMQMHRRSGAAEHARERIAIPMRHLGGAVKVKHIARRIVARYCATRLKRHARVPPDFEFKRNDRMRRGKGRRHVAVTLADHGGFGGMAGGKFDRRRIGGHHFRQVIDFDPNQIGGVFGDIGIGREHDRDRLADIAHAIASEDRLAIGLKTLDARQPEIDRRNISDVGRDPYRDDTGPRARIGAFDRDEAAMGMRGTNHPHISLMRERNVRRKAALADDEGCIFESRHRTANEGSFARHAT